MSDPIDKRVKAALEERRGEWAAISKASKVSHSWLSKFVNGKIENPGLATLRQVEEALNKREKPKARA